LDVNLFEFAYSIPNEHLIKNGYGKYVLREAMQGILNEQVRLDRRKKGFNVSLKSVIDLNDKKTIDYLLADNSVFNIVKREKIERLLKKDYFENSYQKFLFNFINTKIFMENFEL
jgi:asparagine synthase (glutamine-hydrolysing)